MISERGCLNTMFWKTLSEKIIFTTLSGNNRMIRSPNLGLANHDPLTNVGISIIKRVNKNKASFSPWLLYLKSPEFCKNEIQKWGHLAEKCKIEKPQLLYFLFTKLGAAPTFVKIFYKTRGKSIRIQYNLIYE